MHPSTEKEDRFPEDPGVLSPGRRRHLICIPVVARTNEEARIRMMRACKLADVVELRIDGIRDLDLPGLMAARCGEIIVTNRCRREGGNFGGSEKERVSLLEQAVILGADYVDIEQETDENLKEGLIRTIADHRHDTRMIVSWHHMTNTPSDRVLKARMKRCLEDGADMAKIVTMARTAEDNLRILKLVSRAGKEGQAVTAFCMGEKGRMSRAMAPFFGSCMSYAALDAGEASAPGQWTVHDMRDLLRLFHE